MYFPGCFYKSRWEYTIMGKILSLLNSLSLFSSLNQTDPTRKDCGCSLYHPAGSSAQVHKWWVNPITLLCDLCRLKEARQNTEVPKGCCKDTAEEGHSRVTNSVSTCMGAQRGNQLCQMELCKNPFHFQNMSCTGHNSSPLALPWIKPDSCIHYIIIHTQARFSMF